MWRRRYCVLILFACIALGASAWAALAPLSAGAREQAFEIPKGTWARRMSGEKIETLPSEIRLTIGVKDILVLKNHDDVPQMFGPVLLMPGQSFTLPFAVASDYQFACTAHLSGQLTVVVQPMPEPAWWTRLRWRASAIVNNEPAL